MNKLVISSEGLKGNFLSVKKKAGGRRVYCVIKGNGYGMGKAQFVSALLGLGADSFAAVEIDDACMIRRMSADARILLLSPVTDTEKARAAYESKLIPAIGSISEAKLLSSVVPEGEKIDFHLGLDVGMGRFGLTEDALDDAKAINSLPGIKITGAFGHLSFAAVNETKVSETQIARFYRMLGSLGEMGIIPAETHLFSSAGLFRFALGSTTAVRVGSALTGRLPSFINSTGLIPLGRLKSEVIALHTLKKGSYVGYSGVFRAKNDMGSAIVSAGYADGFCVGKKRDDFRRKSFLRDLLSSLRGFLSPSCIFAEINGKRCRCIGKVGMTCTSFSLSGSDETAKIGDGVWLDVNPIFVPPSIEREYV